MSAATEVIGGPDLLTTTEQHAWRRMMTRQYLIRILILVNFALGIYYLSWRYAASINWDYWPLALALLAAETYSFIDACLFGSSMWRWHRRIGSPAKQGDETVDVLICCYNEPVELVRETAEAALRLKHPSRVYICDDGNNPEMRAMAAEIGSGYLTRSAAWQGQDRHAKAGNLINALEQTEGDFLLILDADQVVLPEILDETLGYFRDPKVAFVQTPQWFKNVPEGDPFGSQAPLFYGPIQEAKDGWNAAFFCGSNAVLRREALSHIGLVNYVRDLRRQLQAILNEATRRLNQVERDLDRRGDLELLAAVRALREPIAEARHGLNSGVPLAELTYRFQRQAQASARSIVDADLASIARDLNDIPGLEDLGDVTDRLTALLEDPEAADRLTSRQASPLQAIAEIRELLLRVDVDRAFEATAIMPFSTISVTEDMATAMRMHALGYKSVFHSKILAHGLAPEDLRTALQQRLRWAQGTIQVMFRENPFTFPGLRLMQRLAYFSTMWTYLAGFFAPVYLLSPAVGLLFGWSPVEAWSSEFFGRLIPYLIVNQLLFIVIGWGITTWRGQQYSLALFPIWIKSVTSAFSSVFLGKKLGFVVTPKTRQGGVSLQLIRVQLICMVVLTVAVLIGLTRLVLGIGEPVPIVINVVWAVFDMILLSVVVSAAFHQPDDEQEALLEESFATLHGRAGTGGR
ncbi:MAG TPA: glycosyltransferase [Thermomicrobiales bacterium]|nr:glycosyltransferase [Thermomicrobiales bacterium]